jgi:hypothetical protein
MLNSFNKFPVVLFHENQYGVNRVVSYGQAGRPGGQAGRAGRRQADRPASQGDITDPGINYEDNIPIKTHSQLTTTIQKRQAMYVQRNIRARSYNH